MYVVKQIICVFQRRYTPDPVFCGLDTLKIKAE